MFCVSDRHFGWEEITFPLKADGKLHSYNIDVGNLSNWRDQIIMLGVQPSDAAGDRVSIESIEIAEAPRGPAEFEIGYFGPADGLLRAGRAADISLSVRNLGGEVADSTYATLVVPENVRTIGPAKQTIDRLTHWLPKKVTWQIEATQPGPVELEVRLESPGTSPVSSKTKIEFTPRSSSSADTIHTRATTGHKPIRYRCFLFSRLALHVALAANPRLPDA